MTDERFRELLDAGESEILDFKEQHYFKDSLSDKEKTADFIKDILCFTNTVREESAFIIIGVQEKNRKGIPIGIDPKDSIDDAILQQKIKDKIYPVPKFECYSFSFEGKHFEIIEIPVSWFPSMPLPTRNLKGLEMSRVYIRRGTMNDTAKPNEIKRLDKWLESLAMIPSATSYTSVQQHQQRFNIRKKVDNHCELNNFDDETIQKLFGNEAAEDEDVKRLKEYYFKNEAYERITVDLPIRILVGHKGIGKSALFKVAMLDDHEKHRISLFIKPDEVADLGRNTEGFLELIRSWRIGLYKIIMKKTLQELRIKLPQEDLSNFGTEYDLVEEVIEIVEQHLNKGIIRESKVKIAESFLENRKINIYIDDLDRGWLGGRKDIIRLSALLNATRDLCNENNGLQFKISMRSDVYFLVRTSDESTDKIQGSVVWYSWTNNEILVMLIKRIETFFGREVDEKKLMQQEQRHIAKLYLNPILEPRFTGRGKWEDVPIYKVLMSLVRKRPRDLVKLLTLAARKAYQDKSTVIRTKHFQEIFDEYSQDRVQDTINEYRSELPNIERLIFGMKPSKRTRRTADSYVFSTSDLMLKINNILEQGDFKFTNKKKASAKDLAQFLYKINFLTARKELETGEISRRYFEENRYLSSSFVDFGYNWEIHMAYRWALQPDRMHEILDKI